MNKTNKQNNIEKEKNGKIVSTKTKNATNTNGETIKKLSSDIINIVDKKCIFFREIIQKTLINIQKNKTLNILGTSEVSTCIHSLNVVSNKVNYLTSNMESMNKDDITSSLQNINNDLSLLFKVHGTDSLDDLLTICFGNNNNIIREDDDENKYELLRKYFHPTGYKVINNFQKKEGKFVTIADDSSSEKMDNLECQDISPNVKQFHLKVYGIKVHIYHHILKKNLLIYGILDNVMIEYLNNPYITKKQEEIKQKIPDGDEFKGENFNKFLESLMLKDYLNNQSSHQIYEKFIGLLTSQKALKQKTLNNLVKDFMMTDLFSKRNMIIHLLINSTSYDNKYLAYLLYDLLSNDNNGTIDTIDQTLLMDSFPWEIKQYFKDAMKKTIEYNNELSNFDLNKIPLEQQICLLKANDNVKEKAMMKLKEVKAKSEDSGSKARQYLDGLLKIPFGIVMKEPIMNLTSENNKLFIDALRETPKSQQSNFKEKEKYTSLEIIKYLNNLKNQEFENDYSKQELSKISKNINKIVTKNNLEFNKIKITTSKEELIGSITEFIEFCKDNNERKHCEYLFLDNKIKDNVEHIDRNFADIQKYMKDVKSTLDDAVHGHNNAKKQIERIIGQWINGQQDGYCFGFEGPPGVGKTSIAKKGLSACLKNENGESRPFAMIQMGGDSNGSTLHGHNYTYVGSTWGSIVQILIDNKCMNPIILIDEVDKISKTEHGREIVGILTHLLDPAQNDCFQDKYFTGVDLDLSKALFILSYNDVDAIDKILLDRIHRVKFSNLSIEDKLIISKSHILPEVYKKMGLEEIIEIPDEVIKFLIDEYTCEAGVRKLKEVLFEIVGEINLEILQNSGLYENKINIPIIITIDDIKNKYFKEKHDIKIKKIHEENAVGIINGLWANSVGQGGIIPIQAQWRPSSKFLELHLTGMQGDVMKESMNVALTLAWKLVPENIKKYIQEENCKYANGIHVHCPEGAIPKDGPSAGTAITTVIYSLFMKKKIRNEIAITGEITLDGNITQIGGLDLKIIGGIKAGIKEFIYPEENEKDYQNFMEKYKNSDLVKDIKFNKLNNIIDVFEIVFEDD
jgi:endopeptidase La